MVTRNFKNMLKTVLASASSALVSYGSTVVDAGGELYYLTQVFSGFPYSFTTTPVTDLSSAGICIGSGVHSDYETSDNWSNLRRSITSGVNLSLTTTKIGTDNFGAPYVDYKITVTNTGDAPLTIREVGYRQKVKARRYIGDSIREIICLMDYTVLDTPMVIQAGDAGVLHYRLQSFAEQTKAGVKLVSFSFGTDEEVAAMIDAARNGDIDLQADGGWAVGDKRRIHMNAWTGGNNTAHVAEDLDIAISEFGDYNNCGCLFQFDFVNAPSDTQRMNSSNTTVGGYGATEMYTTTLPAMVEALPEWLKSRLKTFSVLVGAGNQSTEIETVGNNKLALRSEMEVLGTSSHSAPGEGSLIKLYLFGYLSRVKYIGPNYTNADYKNWCFRSPYIENSTQYGGIRSGSASNTFNPVFQAYDATSKRCIIPFGCI